MRYRSAILGVILSLVAVLAACAGDPTATPRPSATSAPAAVVATATIEAMEEPTATGEAMEEPTATGEAMEEPTATGEAMEEPTATGEAMEEPTATGEAMEEPTATGEAMEEPTATGEAMEEPTATVEAMMESMVEAGDEVLLIALNEQNDSGQSGWAALTAKGDQTVVVLDLSSGVLLTELVHIHAGQCGATLGGVAHGLTSFVDGSGASVTTVDASLDTLRTGDFAINSHEAGNPGTYTACGNIPTEAEALTISLDEQNTSGQSGWATLTARGSMTEVVLYLAPGTLQTELVHIHAGQCGATLGGVAHGLTSFVDGAGGSVTLVDTTLNSLRTGDFAINSHEAGKPRHLHRLRQYPGS